MPTPLNRMLSRLAGAFALFAWVSMAAAENPRVNTQTFRPSPHAGDLFTVQSTDTMGEWRWSAAFMASYGNKPLAFVDASRTFPDHEAIQDQLSVDVLGSIRLFDRLSVGLAVPVFLVNQGQDAGFIPIGPISSPAMGDIRLSAKVGVLLREPDEDGLGIAVDLPVGFATGERDSFVSDGWTFTPALLIDLKLGPVLIAANVGAHIRNTEYLPFGTVVDHEFIWRFGVGVGILPDLLTGIVEVYGSSANYNEENNTYVELVLGGRFAVGDSGVAVTLGGGRGLTKGYGATRFRIFGGLGFATPRVRDRDGDGILDPVDACPDVPEDIDGFQDEDGCPEADNDNDGILDGDDRCPNVREDFDGFEDTDGCPDPDNDGDGIPDADDACPDDAEDFDGFEDTDGCPDPDNDGDGIDDKADGAPDGQGWGACRNDPEDRDGFEDEDGCPDPDNDGDGVLDIDDDCPNDASNTCGVVFNPCEIVITEKVHFAYNMDVIKPESYAILDAVTAVLLARDTIELVEVQGHTDNDGPKDYNLDLSQRRADAVVRYLRDKSVAAERLQARGYGEDKPIASNRSGMGRAKNRRVQFIILKPSQAECVSP